jgi:GntR family transcriptional repressor for pyruvate dehydrogenase complex
MAPPRKPLRRPVPARSPRGTLGARRRLDPSGRKGRRSLSDEVFERLRDEILRGERVPGSLLPGERALGRALGVNRGAVREALRRLEQARLVVVRQGGSSRVLDYRESGGLELLGALVVGADGRFSPQRVRAVLELRSALGADVARLGALRGGSGLVDRLEVEVRAMRRIGAQPARLQDPATRFWAALVDGADNVAYRLAFNALNGATETCRVALVGPLAEELSDLAGYEAILGAIRCGDAAAAEASARALLRRGEAGVRAALGGGDGP